MLRIELPEGIGQEQMDGLLRRYLDFPAGELNRMDLSPNQLISFSKRLVAGAKRLFEDAKKEKRELTVEEGRVFDYALNLADWQKQQAERGGLGVRGGGRIFDGSSSRGREESASRRPALRFLDDGGNEIRGLRFDESIRGAIPVPALPDGIQVGELSIGRLVRAAVTGDWRHAEAEKRAMGGSVDTLGGYTVPSELAASIIDLARNQAVVLQAGGVTVPMLSNSLVIAKLLKDAPVGWKVENQPGTLDQMSFGKVTLNARTLMALISASVELVEDAKNLADLIQTSLAAALALELDRAALRGDGGNASPVGIRNTAGIQKIDLGTDGAALTNFDHFSEAAEKILTKNGIPRTAIFAPRTFGVLDRLKQATTNAPLPPPQSFADMQKLVTNQIPINSVKGASQIASEAYVGDFEQLLLGSRTDLVLEITRVAGDSGGGAFRSLQVWIRAYLRADVALARAEHFCLIDGIVP